MIQKKQGNSLVNIRETLLLNFLERNLLTKKFWWSPNQYIKEGNKPCSYFSHIDPRRNREWNLTGRISICINPIISCNIERSLEMEILRNNDISCLRKHLPGTDYRIKSTKSCIIKNNLLFWDSCLYKCLFHKLRLIVWIMCIISGGKNRIYLFCIIELFRSMDSLFKEYIFPPFHRRSSSKKESDLFLWQSRSFLVYKSAHRWKWTHHKKPQYQERKNSTKKKSPSWFHVMQSQ